MMRIQQYLPVALACLLSWGLYLVLVESFRLNEVVAGHNSMLMFVLFLSYFLVLIYILNKELFRKAVYAYGAVMGIVMLTYNLGENFLGMLMMIGLGFAIGSSALLLRFLQA